MNTDLTVKADEEESSSNLNTSLDNKVNQQQNDTPTRRSQRQIERVERTTLEKIKEENQKLLKEANQQKNQIAKESTNDNQFNNDNEDQIEIEQEPIKQATKDDEDDEQQLLISDLSFRNETDTSLSMLNESDKSEILLTSTTTNELNKSTTTKNKRSPRVVAVENVIVERVSTRPQRQRKIPKRWEDAEIEVGSFRRLSNAEKPIKQEKKANDKSPAANKSAIIAVDKLTIDNLSEGMTKDFVIKLTDIKTENLNFLQADNTEIKEQQIVENDDKLKEEDIRSDENELVKDNNEQIENKLETAIIEECKLKSREENQVEIKDNLINEIVNEDIIKEEKKVLAKEEEEKVIKEDENTTKDTSKEEHNTIIEEEKVIKEEKIEKQVDQSKEIKEEDNLSNEDKFKIENEKTTATESSISKLATESSISKLASESIENSSKKESASYEKQKKSSSFSSVKTPIKSDIQSKSSSGSGSSEEIGEDDQEWESEDDPDKLWCICRKPHNNRFMIQCDQCRDWFHGKCVSISQSQGMQYEKQGKKWFCIKCREEQQNDRILIPDKKKIFKDKIKELTPLNKPKSSLTLNVNKRKSLDSLIQKKPKPLDNNQGELKERRKSSLDSLTHLDKKIKKSPPDLAHRDKPKLSRSYSTDEELKLKKLIKSKKTELINKKLSSSFSELKEQRKSSPSIDRSSSVDSTSQDKQSNQSKSDSLKNETIKLNQQQEQLKLKDDKKKKSSISLDPFIGDLFKPAEPVIIQKTKKLSSLHRSNSISSSDAGVSGSLICVYLECKRPHKKLNDKESVYCSKECLEKHVKESISLVRKIKLSNAKTNLERKSVKEDDKKVTLVEKRSGKYLSGNNAITEDKILDHIWSNPTFEILLPTTRKHSTNDSLSSSNKKQQQTSSTNASSNPQNSLKDQKSSSTAAAATATANAAVTTKESTTSSTKETSDYKRAKNESEIVRYNVKKQLKKAFSTRLENCKDLDIERSEMKKIASKIENELFNYFKEANSKYKNKFRSLLFNLSDAKNEGLFRKVLTMKLQADKLVRMSSEDLASPELAKWRERENRHSIEMIKKDAEQQAHQIVVKKTHKGKLNI